MADEPKAKSLTDKQRVFVEEYLRCWNAAEAARLAGYSERSAKEIGAENLTKPNIVEMVQQRMAEKVMSADEVLVRLAEHARGSIRPFVQQVGESIRVDITEDEEGEKPLHLIKKIKIKHRMGSTKDGGEFEEFENEIELHDAQAALVHLGRHHKLFTDKSELTGKDDGPVEVKVLRVPAKRDKAAWQQEAQQLQNDKK